MIKIGIAGLTIGLDNRYTYVERLAADYTVSADAEVDFTVGATDAEIMEERGAAEAEFSDGYLESIVLSGEIKRALKENLDRKDNYTLNYKSEFSFRGTCKALYIHESEIQVVDLGDVLAMETSEEKNYLHI